MSYPFFLAVIGFFMLALAGLPLALRRLPLSLPVVLVALGIVLALLPLPGEPPDPREFPLAVERITEFLVIVSLMGAGLKLDTPVGLRRWADTWRLIGIAMPLSILGFALLGWGVLGLSAASAILLAASLAPTDPVLAADVQVGAPGEGEEDRVRFALTSEAGLNDSAAFPFVFLAIAVAAHGPAPGVWTLEWFTVYVLWRVAAGVAAGWLVGRLAAVLLFGLPKRLQLASAGDGFVAVGVTLLAYGVTELAYGYGFLAVFVAGVTIRSRERGHDYHGQLHDFAEEVERLTMAVLLVLFGAGLVSGLVDPVAPAVLIFAVIAIVVVRPVATLASLAGSGAPTRERLAVSFFGIRGVGSVYYLAYGLNHGEFLVREEATLWAATAVVIALSILVHGTTATPIMSRFGKRAAEEDEGGAGGEGRAAARAGAPADGQAGRSL
jgi:sodium/hydrogen antiporter